MRTIEELKTIANEMNKPLEILLYEMLSDAMKELDQYKNNWEELKRWLNTKINDYKKYDIDDFTIYQHVLIKMKELEENN